MYVQLVRTQIPGDLMDLQHYTPFWLYFVAFAVIIVGLIVYFWSSTREFRYEESWGKTTLTPYLSRIAGQGRPASTILCQAKERTNLPRGSGVGVICETLCQNVVFKIFFRSPYLCNFSLG